MTASGTPRGQAFRHSASVKGRAQRVAEFLIDLASWLALAYLGFWLAQALDSLVAQVAVYPLVGGYIQGWFVRPFRLSVVNADFNISDRAASWLLCLPLFLEAAYLLAVTVWVRHVRDALLRASFLFGGLWVVILMSVQIVQLFFDRDIDLVRFLRLLVGGHAGSGPFRLAFGGAVAALVLLTGAICARQLVSEVRQGWRLASKSWLAVLLLSLPVLLIVWGLLGFRWHGFSRLGVVILLAPPLLCGLLGVIGLRRQPSVSASVRHGKIGAVAAVCFAGLVYGGLWAVPRTQTWRDEHRMAELASAHYKIRYDSAHFSRQFIEGLAAKRETILAREAALLKFPVDSARLHLFIYGDFSAERRATSSREPYSVDGTAVRAVLGGYIQELDPAADAAALLNAVWGGPGSRLLGAWVARWLAGEWRGRSVDAWAAQIQSEVRDYSLAELLSDDSGFEISPLVRAPLAATWVGWVYDRFGLDGVHKVYSTTEEPAVNALAQRLGMTAPQLEQSWREWTATLQTKHPSPASQPRSTAEDFFFRGVSFSQEGWGAAPGALVSSEAAEQLRQIRDLNADAVALVPYGFMRSASDEGVSYVDTGETDEDMIEAGWVAHQLGMKVMLKPQLWVGGGQFTGQIHFDRDSDRARWMRSYREFILHYARLAEVEHFDLLCIGNELEGVSSDEAAWRDMIRDVRSVYHGPLTYAANWGKEFFAVRFWDALDYAGLNNYYPLASAPSADANDLKPGADALASKLEAFSGQWRKPIVFTEVGYPSVHGAAVEPWIHDASRGLSGAEQAACYEAILRAFAGHPWFRGMFWWKWPSDGRRGGRTDGSYTPMGKPAAGVIRDWYTRMAGEGARASVSP